MTYTHRFLESVGILNMFFLKCLSKVCSASVFIWIEQEARMKAKQISGHKRKMWRLERPLESTETAVIVPLGRSGETTVVHLFYNPGVFYTLQREGKP